MKQKIILFLLTMLVSLTTYAQQQTEMRGNVINAATNEPVPGVLVSFRGQSLSTKTDAKGEFHFPSIAAGKDMLTLNSADIRSRELEIEVESNSVLLLKDIKVEVIAAGQNMHIMGVIDESTIDDEGPTQEISSMIILSNDVYLNKVNFQLSPFRFNIRGYDNTYQNKYINGVKFNDQNRGVFNYASIGALNDLTRNGDAVNYHDANTFTFGTIGGSENLDMRAGSYAKGGKITASYTNRNYFMRGMATYSTGLMDDGYAFTVSVGGRYADEGQIKGTSYRNISYAIALEKQWNEGKHSFSFSTFGSPVERAQQGASYQEIYDLVGDNTYNPNWGLYNGKKKNSRMVRAFDPTAIFSHIWKPNRNFKLTTGYGVHYQYDRRSALNWYNGADPRPDYYRYIPSYYEIMGADWEAEIYKERWRSKDSNFTQINWDQMVEVNKTRGLNDVEKDKDKDFGRAAIYMIEGRRSDLFEHTFNSTFNLTLPNNLNLAGGLGARTTQSKQFKEVLDLLGSDFVMDIDKFSERDFGVDDAIKQNNMDQPNRRAYKGDTFGYDFRLNIHSANIWWQGQFHTRNIDLYFANSVEWTSFSRTGDMRNGRFPDSSHGKGKSHTFIDFGVKGGFTYKFSGRHFLSTNINFMTKAPLPNNAYITSRISDITINNIPDASTSLRSEKIFSADINYVFSLPQLRGRVTAFHTSFFDKMKKVSYYHDSQKTFMHHVMNGLNSKHQGFELAVAYQIDNNWSVDLAGTVAEYYYDNNPEGVLVYENNRPDAGDPVAPETVYMKDSYIAGTPQVAATLGVNYFINYWFFNLSLNGIARTYIDVAPVRRIASVYADINPLDPKDKAAFDYLTGQERAGSSYTLDFSIGKIFYLANRQSFNMNLSFNNILNRENIRTGGYQQGRIDLENPTKFAAKYYYQPGFNCFINASYRF